MSRYLGNIVDLLVTPITPPQFILAYTLAAMLRGLLVGLTVWLISTFFAHLPWVHPLAGGGHGRSRQLSLRPVRHDCRHLRQQLRRPVDVHQLRHPAPDLSRRGFLPHLHPAVPLGEPLPPQSPFLPDRRFPPRPARRRGPVVLHLLSASAPLWRSVCSSGRPC